MPRYTVNATLNVPAWVTIEAESEDAAEADAELLGPSSWEYDMSSAEVDFNVTPAVEAA